MGFLWWKGKEAPAGKNDPCAELKPDTSSRNAAEAPGMNGAVEVRRPEDVTVFEFGSVAVSGDRVTLAGYCPVSEDLEPCHWEILAAPGPDAPQFRVVF